LHPSFAQAGPDLHNLDFKRYPNLKKDIHCLEAVLGPGDLLYLPPLYWHHVVSIEASISVNVWGKSEFQKSFDNAIGSTLKAVNHEWDGKHKRAAAIYIINRLLLRLPMKNLTTATLEGPGSKQFIRQLLQIRYSHVVLDGIVPTSCSIRPKSLCPSKKILTKKEKKRLRKLVKNLFKQFSFIKSGIRPIYVRNYVETLAYWSSGPKDASPFLHTCWK